MKLVTSRDRLERQLHRHRKPCPARPHAFPFPTSPLSLPSTLTRKDHATLHLNSHPSLQILTHRNPTPTNTTGTKLTTSPNAAHFGSTRTPLFPNASKTPAASKTAKTL